MLGWAWQYFAFARGARLITGRTWEPAAPGADPAAGTRSAAPPAASTPGKR
jgi:hypothetical protein